MLIEPYNFSKEHYEKYSNIKDDKESFEYDNIKQYNLLVYYKIKQNFMKQYNI